MKCRHTFDVLSGLDLRIPAWGRDVFLLAVKLESCPEKKLKACTNVFVVLKLDLLMPPLTASSYIYFGQVSTRLQCMLFSSFEWWQC